MQNLISNIGSFIQAPFKERLDLFHLFLIVGLVIIFAAAWVFILHNVKMAAAEVI